MIDPEAGFGELRAGNLGVRIAISADEVDAAQALRYRIFYGEMGAHADAATAATARDRDAFDAVADHLLVTSARESRYRTGAMSSRLAQMAIVDFVVVRLLQREMDRAGELLRRTYDAVQAHRLDGGR